MRHILLTVIILFSAIGYSQVRIGNTDRQKVDSLLVRNDSLIFKIENDIKRRVDLSALSLGVPDGGKGDIFVSGGGLIWGLEPGVVESSNIFDGTIQAVDLETTNSPTDGYFPSYDSASGGFTWESISGTDSGSGYTFNTISTDDRHFTDSDVTVSGAATGKKIWNRVTATADSLWLHKDSLSLQGNPFIIQNWGADSTVVRRGAGTSFYVADSSAVLSSDFIVIKQRHPVTAIKTDASSFFLQGNFTTGFNPPSNLYTTLNAANPNNETNASTGVVETLASVTISSTTEQAQAGTYSLKFLHSGGINDDYRATIDTGIASGLTVEVSFWVYEGTGTNHFWGLNAADGWTTTQQDGTNTLGAWTQKTFTATSNAANPKIRVEGSASSDTGDVLYVDNIVITVL